MALIHAEIVIKAKTIKGDSGAMAADFAEDSEGTCGFAVPFDYGRFVANIIE